MKNYKYISVHRYQMKLNQMAKKLIFHTEFEESKNKFVKNKNKENENKQGYD